MYIHIYFLKRFYYKHTACPLGSGWRFSHTGESSWGRGGVNWRDWAESTLVSVQVSPRPKSGSQLEVLAGGGGKDLHSPHPDCWQSSVSVVVGWRSPFP